MSDKYSWVDLPARISMALLFMISPFYKVTETAAFQGLMRSHNLPGILIWPAAIWEFTAGICLILGFALRPISILIIGWCILTAVLFHNQWTDPNQLINFYKNMTMAGGFAFLAKLPPGAYSIDRYLASRRGGLGRVRVS